MAKHNQNGLIYKKALGQLLVILVDGAYIDGLYIEELDGWLYTRGQR